MHKETFIVGSYLITFILLCLILFFCDYIQVKKKTSESNRVHQEMNAQISQIQFFSVGIEHLERQISKLKKLDRRIHRIANLQGIEERREEEKAALEGIMDVAADQVAIPVTKRKQ